MIAPDYDNVIVYNGMLSNRCAPTIASSIVCDRPHGIEQGEANDEDEEEEREVEEEEEEEVTHNATINELVIIITLSLS